MARQTGKTSLVGRVGDVIYYKMNGKYYARAVSSLKAKRVKRDPKFKRTMEFAQLFGQASKLASAVYRSLPACDRNYKLYRKMAGKANRLLMEGIAEETVEILLREFAYAGKKVNSKVVVMPLPVKPSNVKHGLRPFMQLKDFAINNRMDFFREKLPLQFKGRKCSIRSEILRPGEIECSLPKVNSKFGEYLQIE